MARIPFGILSSPEVFHKAIEQAFEGCKGQVSYIDYSLVFGKDQTEHVEKTILERFMKERIHFNKEKCTFGVRQIRFVVHIIRNKNIGADTKHIRCTQEMKILENKRVEKFFALIYVLSKIGTYVIRFN